MISGFSEQWQCEAGEWSVWAPDAVTRETMKTAPDLGVRTAFIQADHLRSGIDGEACVRRLVFTTFTIHDVFDEKAMTSVFSDFVRAHGIFHTAFPVTTDLDPRGRTLQPEQISLAITATSATHPAATVKDYLMAEVPDLNEWAAFAFAVTGTEHARPGAADPRFEVVVCSDHLYTDGVSQAVGFFELVSRYTAARAGTPFTPPPVRPYRDFTAEQRTLAATLTPTHPDVVQWRETLRRAGGMPRFPLPLGLPDGACAPGRIAVHSSFVDAGRTARFGAAARCAGANMSSALLAVLGQVHHALTGDELFTMLIPRADRSATGDAMAVGWYVTLVPVQFSANGSFDEVARRAHEAVAVARQLDRTPVFPVIDLLADDPEFPVEHGFSAPMLSYIDVTRVPGADLARHHDFSVFANATPSREVFTWINRDTAGLDFNAMHPDTPQAARAVDTVFRLLRDRIIEIADRAPALQAA
ncbi:condensation domain-containing protein [Tsukamurella sp. PLM1]|uniref:condensation domain-containing protein n=1 Tax=Tsukamurella sp. PLM1 TaxID=2929795 RepID=UPI0020C0FEB6|nr:condensation domain-containing protein [Tsukamurella sp. PLM1]